MLSDAQERGKRQISGEKNLNKKQRKINIKNRKYNMCSVDDHGYGDSSSNGEVAIKKRRKLSESIFSSSPSKFSSNPSDSSQEESIFGILVAHEVNKKKQQRMKNTPTIGHGLISVIGRQRSMEDTFTVFPNLVHLTRDDDDDDDETSYDFFAVFDGHGGHKVSHKCKDRLHHLVAEELAREGQRRMVDWQTVMGASFARMDAEVAEGDVVGRRQRDMKTVGSTALVVVVGMKEIVVANCGDCRVVLFRDGAPLPLSCDHKPERPDEKERMEAAGGNVVDSDCSRVLGVLSTSRSIGDNNLKPYVISEPEVQVCERKSLDDFLVIATDGLWDVVTNEIVCDLTRKCFSGELSRKALEEFGGSCSAAAATLLAELAIARGSNDNISVIVVQLNKFDTHTTSSAE